VDYGLIWAGFSTSFSGKRRPVFLFHLCHPAAGGGRLKADLVPGAALTLESLALVFADLVQ
jgi:hypothetical protein